MSSAIPQATGATAPVETHGRSGSVMPYLMHLRPMAWPIVALHATTGWWLASGPRAVDGQAVLGIAVWVVALNGGTLALNSAYDHDDGDIAYLHHPPAPPRALSTVAIGLLVLGLVVTWGLPIAYRVAYAICALLSVAASLPPLRLNARLGAGWLVSALGYGPATLFAGWALSGRAITTPLLALMVGSLALFAGFYPLTQLYQRDDDRTRGDETVAVRLGVQYSLAIAMVQVLCAFVLFCCAAVLYRWELPLDWARYGALTLAGMAWAVVLWPWFQNGRSWSSAEHQRGMYHAVAAWALTDAALLIGWAL